MTVWPLVIGVAGAALFFGGIVVAMKSWGYSKGGVALGVAMVLAAVVVDGAVFGSNNDNGSCGSGRTAYDC